MDKNVLKKFAIESRQELMEKVANKINRYFVDEEFNVNQNGEVYVLVNDKHTLRLTKSEYENRQLLVKRIKEITLEQVIEEAAYTWFNRIIAIRYMEIHDYLPLTKDNQSLGVRVLSSKDNTPDPEIMKISNLINPDLDIEFNKEYYGTIQDNNKRFEYILLLICKKLGKVIPQVFDGVTDYIDILIPDNLLNDSGYITKLLNDVSEDNFEKVEIIGWLYQYYISEKKDKVFADLKKNIKINKENIPSATQIFTPNWIVKYMVENTVGRYTTDKFKTRLKYYVKNKEENTNICNVENIKFIDPCCGSGHILVYAFEMFVNIYKENGYSINSIPELIIKNNINGLDIDDRAGQLSILSVILKAREYDKNIFNKNIINDINIMSIQETSQLDYTDLQLIKNSDESINETIDYIYKTFNNAKEIGSLLVVNKDKEYDKVIEIINKLDEEELNIFDLEKYKNIKKKFLPIVRLAKILSRKYEVVVTNPPYMGNRGMDTILSDYVKKYYEDYKTDLFSAFIKQAYQLAVEDGYYALITQPTFLFISSFEKVREDMINKNCIISLLHMGRGIFGIDFGSTSFVLQKRIDKNYCGSYFRLNKRTFQYIDVEDIEKIYLNAKDDNNYTFDFNNYVPNSSVELEDIENNTDENEENNDTNGVLKIKFETNQSNFENIPGSPFAYWASEKLLNAFKVGKQLGEIVPIKQGLATADNNRFLRLWYEVDNSKISFNKDLNKKWYPYNKGGAFRKWYGNNDYVVNWEKDGYEIKNFKDEKGKLRSRPQNTEYYFRKSVTWSLISAGSIAFRYKPNGHIFDIAGMSCFPNDEIFDYILALNNSNIINDMMKFIAPTLNYQVGDIAKIPVIFTNKEVENIISKLTIDNINMSKEDWDESELSWDFKCQPLIKLCKTNNSTINQIFNEWNSYTLERFRKLKNNEEELNKLFLNIYNLEDEYTNTVEDKDVTIKRAEKVRDVKSLISYAVGCMFGRYSLNKDGLVYAGGRFESVYEKYKGQNLIDENGQPLPGNNGGWAGVSLSDYKYIKDGEKEIELSYSPDIDNIIPLTEDNYFGDDIVSRFKKFIEVVYGKETLYENLDFIAETLGKKNGENSEETIRRYFINDFYNDHVKMYQKRPIYWLFDSGKKNGFKCLIYMHRYNEGLVSKIRLDYLHRMQNTYEKELKEIADKLNNDVDLTSKRELSKRQADISAKLQETNEYDEKIAHIADQRIKIDLDDGVVVNYAKFSVKNPKTGKDESILAKIK